MNKTERVPALMELTDWSRDRQKLIIKNEYMGGGNGEQLVNGDKVIVTQDD